ncbi:MAG: HAMP domain-containing histidine kinase [Defluviitaleaceae bacterium]|nr:HAMP domain-containing histidine kinase [Defluviitaleaceae bacterium]
MLDTGGQNRYIRISGEDSQELYASGGFCADNQILSGAAGNALTYKIEAIGGRYYIQTAVKVTVIDRALYLETLRDITGVFQQRESGFTVYRRVCAVVLLCEGVIIFLLSHWLTRPVRLLSRAARNMAGGNYGYRAKKVSNDELGGLTEDFNEMASSLENDVEWLEEAARSQEEFVGAFAHELKTPLTAIIGYADMLRSQKLGEETQMLSADYIYQEGRRLEKLAFNLLDIIVLKRQDKPSSRFRAEAVFEYLRDTFSKLSVNLTLDYDESEICGDMPLIKTLLTNLIDNSVKASEPSGLIEVTGVIDGRDYVFTVRDHGSGIPAESLDRITEAFYMVDKSRSRSRHGAGLGLTLCAEIARLHGTELEIESEVGVGTSISFALEIGARGDEERDNGARDDKTRDGVVNDDEKRESAARGDEAVARDAGPEGGDGHE